MANEAEKGEESEVVKDQKRKEQERQIDENAKKRQCVATGEHQEGTGLGGSSEKTTAKLTPTLTLCKAAEKESKEVSPQRSGAKLKDSRRSEPIVIDSDGEDREAPRENDDKDIKSKQVTIVDTSKVKPEFRAQMRGGKKIFRGEEDLRAMGLQKPGSTKLVVRDKQRDNEIHFTISPMYFFDIVTSLKHEEWLQRNQLSEFAFLGWTDDNLEKGPMIEFVRGIDKYKRTIEWKGEVIEISKDYIRRVFRLQTSGDGLQPDVPPEWESQVVKKKEGTKQEAKGKIKGKGKGKGKGNYRAKSTSKQHEYPLGNCPEEWRQRIDFVQIALNLNTVRGTVPRYLMYLIEEDLGDKCWVTMLYSKLWKMFSGIGDQLDTYVELRLSHHLRVIFDDIRFRVEEKRYRERKTAAQGLAESVHFGAGPRQLTKERGKLLANASVQKPLPTVTPRPSSAPKTVIVSTQRSEGAQPRVESLQPGGSLILYGKEKVHLGGETGVIDNPQKLTGAVINRRGYQKGRLFCDAGINQEPFEVGAEERECAAEITGKEAVVGSAKGAEIMVEEPILRRVSGMGKRGAVQDIEDDPRWHHIYTPRGPVGSEEELESEEALESDNEEYCKEKIDLATTVRNRILSSEDEFGIKEIKGILGILMKFSIEKKAEGLQVEKRKLEEELAWGKKIGEEADSEFSQLQESKQQVEAESKEVKATNRRLRDEVTLLKGRLSDLEIEGVFEGKPQDTARAKATKDKSEAEVMKELQVEVSGYKLELEKRKAKDEIMMDELAGYEEEARLLEGRIQVLEGTLEERNSIRKRQMGNAEEQLERVTNEKNHLVEVSDAKGEKIVGLMMSVHGKEARVKDLELMNSCLDRQLKGKVAKLKAVQAILAKMEKSDREKFGLEDDIVFDTE